MECGRLAGRLAHRLLVRYSGDTLGCLLQLHGSGVPRGVHPVAVDWYAAVHVRGAVLKGDGVLRLPVGGHVFAIQRGALLRGVGRLPLGGIPRGRVFWGVRGLGPP